VRVVLSGASGLIGQALQASLREDGHTVLALVRRDPRSDDEARWDPAGGRLDAALLDGADAVVCLSGAGVGDHRWTAAYKETIRRSRVDSVATVARAMAAHGGPPVLLAASAVGYYGDTGDRVVTEQSPSGTTFLAGVCREWEAAAEPARAAGLRVAHLRTGLVVAGQAALIKRLRPLVLLGVAGKLGSGRQYFPWIHLADEVGAIRYLLTHDIAGPVNLTAPNPVPNAEFIAALGSVLHRPTVLPAPGFALRAALGQFAEDVLTGQRALPAVLSEAGYPFRYPDLEPALRAALTE
jgi:uncharacterized protein (TIGR01777 family)